MKKHKLIAEGVFKLLPIFVFLLGSNSVCALDVTSYFELKKAAMSGATNAQTARLTIDAYHQGIAETVSAVYEFNNGVIYLKGAPYACPPNVQAITSTTVEAAIEQVIGSPNKPTPLPDDLKKGYVGGVAIVGFSFLFPCGGQK